MSDHEHEWGDVEFAHFTGNPHRKCQVSGCDHVTLDLHDDEITDWTVTYEIRDGDDVTHRGDVTVWACEDSVEECAREEIFRSVLGIERADINAKVVPLGWPSPHLSAWRMDDDGPVVVLDDCVRHAPVEDLDAAVAAAATLTPAALAEAAQNTLALEGE